jgi:hypothetical protein
VPRRVLLWVAVLLASVTLLAAPAGDAWASAPTTDTVPADTVPISTVNEFLPEDRSIGECISAVPKPGCGSEERGGWRQYLVAVAMVGGLVFVGWRVVVGVRRGRQEPAPG